MKKLITIFLFILINCLSDAYAQEDSLKTIDLDDVVVTATRNERQLSKIPMMVNLVKKEQIQQMGSLRLNEILQEQTGLAIVTDHGQGIQMQGFDPDYTLILIDGEPIIGRTAGTLELSRLAVGNIKQIEIIKGPCSSLYGSEALAGVVNIITERPDDISGTLTARYGTNTTTDFSGSFNFRKDKVGVYLFANRYSSEGYDFTPETFGQTIEPFNNYTFQSKLYYDFSNRLKFSISGRFFQENQTANFNLGDAQNPNLIEGKGTIQDYNLNPILDWQLNDKWTTQFRFYASSYETQTNLFYKSDNSLYESTFFRQNFFRAENQTEYFLSDAHIFTFGAGNIWESVEATRYTAKRRFQTQYFFFQYELNPNERWNVVAGGRWDNHSVYGSQFSPKLALQYNISPKIALRASTGVGFKAPDFRQLYLNFTNTVAGYSVYGTEELPAILSELQANGQIAGLLLDPSVIGNIQAETSISYNVGFKVQVNEKTRWEVNAFRNDISNLIETQIFAVRTGGQNIFSYRNLNQVFTQGIESNLSYQVLPSLKFSLGYQYLEAKDKEVLKQIENGELFRRNPNTLATTRVKKSDYRGLFGRSRSMLNCKIFYDNVEKGISANLRGIYRSRYGFADRNGNLILDADNEYVAGYWTWNLSVAKDFWENRLRLQLGCDNLLDFRDEVNIPNLAGRLLWINLQLQLKK